MKNEINNIMKNDPSIKSKTEAILHPFFKAIIYYRISNHFYLKKHYIIARYLCEKAKRKTGIEIHPGATIGKNLFIDHGSGVVIGETSILRDNIIIFQGVTLGSRKETTGKRHPTIENNVFIGAGAKILGNITIGENSKIGANAIVIDNIEKNSTVVCPKGIVIKKSN